MDRKKVKAITEMKPPENLQDPQSFLGLDLQSFQGLDLQSFLGLENYLNRFIPKLAYLTAPLRALWENDTPFTWENSQ